MQQSNQAVSKESTFDVIVAGAGASGLSLVVRLLQNPLHADLRILLVDRALVPYADKTWCFWDSSQLPFPELIHKSWNELQVRALGNTYNASLQKYQYHCIRSKDFSQNLLERVRQSDQVTMLEADISGFGGDEQTGEIYTSAGTFRARWVFQSALRPPGFESMRMDLSLKQHFRGWIIQTPTPVFDAQKATFMDFDVPQKNGVTFMYVLPFSSTEALVEYTLFSAELLDDQAYNEGLQDYLADRLGLAPNDYTITYVEDGVIPMEDRRYPVKWAPRVWNTGSVGGLTKPSTGYTFIRIQRQNRVINDALAQGIDPVLRAGSPYRFRVYDIMLLYQLLNHPDTSVRIFHELFRRNRMDALLHFLGEQTHPGQEARIFASLPWMPFFQSIFKMKGRLLTGA